MAEPNIILMEQYTLPDEPVGFNSDKLDYYLSQGTTWFRNLKWKPSEDNTIDFLIRFEKQEVSRYRDQVIYKNKIKTIKENDGYKKYIIGNLYNTGFENTIYDPCQQVKNNCGKVKPIPFNPPKPVIDNIHFGLFKQNTNLIGDPIISLDDELVEDDTIIEVNYTNFKPDDFLGYEKNKNKRFNILRTRHDKTYMHRIAVNRQKELFKIIQKCKKIISSDNNNPKAVQFLHRNRYLFSKSSIAGNLKQVAIEDIVGRLRSKMTEINKYYKDYSDVTTGINVNYNNSVDVANNIWMSIYNPVTTKIITTGKEIPEIAEEEQRYYNRNEGFKRDKSITISLQNFHNKIIKKRILLENVANTLRLNGINDISLLDLSCGKGGDIANGKIVVLNDVLV